MALDDEQQKITDGLQPVSTPAALSAVAQQFTLDTTVAQAPGSMFNMSVYLTY